MLRKKEKSGRSVWKAGMLGLAAFGVTYVSMTGTVKNENYAPEPAERSCRPESVDDVLAQTMIEKAQGKEDYLDAARRYPQVAVFLYDDNDGSIGLAYVVDTLAHQFPEVHFVGYKGSAYKRYGQELALPGLLLYRNGEERRRYEAYGVRNKNIDATVARVKEDFDRVFGSN